MTAGAGATVRTVLDTGGGLVRRQVEVPAGARHAHTYDEVVLILADRKSVV